ncbi:MAG: hypothetical protein H6Q15_358 [Bacteroidetes bacterium]|nr:hypothetical protein [Bacteroidota bacterium]
MKSRRIFIIVFLFIISVAPAKAQIFKGMAIFGGNFSQIDGDQVVGYYKFGLNTGVGVMAPLNAKRNWLASMEILYNRIGSKESRDPFQYIANLHYASIPLLIHYEDKKGGWTFGAGLQYSRLFKVSEDWGLPSDTIKYMDRPVLETVKDFNRNDISAILDLRFKIVDKLKFNFRYQYSLIPIRQGVTYFNGFRSGDYEYSSWKRNFYNNVLTFRLIYMINERSSSELDKNIRRNEY